MSTEAGGFLGKLDADGLVRTCAYPREVFFVADLPKTATGKIQRVRLR